MQLEDTVDLLQDQELNLSNQQLTSFKLPVINDSRAGRLENGLMGLGIQVPSWKERFPDPGKATDERRQLYVNVHSLSWRSSEV
ncbi:27448_t:CDS:2 [Dentiscutata erythropus]|uniref:27448_t:CDS:1 n=1 Tax=Dentiscutata erythropus TaxID=1348616 RepID=A0A9N9B2L8_9GLOM|nr:27448_t:CDS:2 [Dentiscutata erythropus]